MQQSLTPTFSWMADATAINYDFELATDASFTTILDGVTTTATTYNPSVTLTHSTSYYWRVKGNNTCGTSNNSSGFSFTTDAIICSSFSANDLPKDISSSGSNTVSSTISVPSDFTIIDVNVTNLKGTHTWIADLDATLKSPNGTTVVLFNSPCDDEDNWDIKFDAAAASSTLPCPLTDGNTYQPKGSLSDFNGENSTGNWKLSIIDNYNEDGGQFLEWSIELCQLSNATGPTPNAPTNLTATTISSSQIDLDWTDNANNELGYIIDRSSPDNSNYSTIDTVGPNVTTYADNGLNSGTLYFYKVAAYNANGVSDYSEEDSAFTDTETAIIDFVLDNSTTIYPNPTNDYINVFIKQKETGDLELSVYDVAGKVIIIEAFEKTTLEFSKKLDVSQLSDGMYIVKVRLEDAQMYRKIQKQ